MNSLRATLFDHASASTSMQSAILLYTNIFRYIFRVTFRLGCSIVPKRMHISSNFFHLLARPPLL